MSRGVLIGIAGGSASGKTLVAAKIYESLGPEGVAILRQDAYYRDLKGLTPEQRAQHNFDHPDAFDTPLLLEHIEALLRGESVEEPIYDFTRHMRSEKTRRVRAVSVVILEGILVLSEPSLLALMDIRVFVDTDADVRLLRRLRRDVHERGRTVESVLSQYETFVRPMHLQFVEPSKRFADVIIPEGGHNRVGVDLLATKVLALKSERVVGLP